MMEGLKHMDGLSQMLMAIFFVIMTYRIATQPSKPQHVLWWAGTMILVPTVLQTPAFLAALVPTVLLMVFAPIVDMAANRGSFHSLGLLGLRPRSGLRPCPGPRDRQPAPD